MRPCFKANLNLLNKQNVKQIYKYYIAFKDLSLKNKDTFKQLMVEIKNLKSTPTKIIEQCIENLLISYPKISKNDTFYTQIASLILGSP